MERTAARCDHCQRVVTAAVVDGDLQPLGQLACPECEGTEFTEYEPASPDDADRTRTG